MKKFISILAIAAVAALAFVSCNKEDKDNVKGTYTLDYDVLDDTNLSEDEMEDLEDYLDPLVEGVVWVDTPLSTVVKQMNSWIKETGPHIASQFPDNYFTVQFGIVNDKDEWVKYVTAKCKNGKLIN